MLAGPTTLPSYKISSMGCLGTSTGHVWTTHHTRTCAGVPTQISCAKANPTIFQCSDLRKQRRWTNAGYLVWPYLT